MKTWYSDRQHVLRCIRQSEEDRDAVMDSVEHRENMALGAMCPKGRATGLENPDNLAFSTFSLLLPSMVTSAPAMKARSSGPHAEQVQAAALSSAVTRIAHKSKMHRELEPSAWDFFFKPFCAGFIEMGQAQMSDLTKWEREAAKGRLHHKPDEEIDVGGEEDDEPTPRATDTPSVQVPPRWPRFKSLDPRQCGYDTSGRSLSQARFTWHVTIEDYELLMQRAEENPGDWDVDAIMSMPRCNRDGNMGQGETGDYARYYVIYIPGGVLEDEKPGRNDQGVILTVAGNYDGGDSKAGDITGATEIRRAYYWKGHPAGPHVFEGQYTTGVSSHFVTLLGVNEDALAMVESVTAAVHERIHKHKTVHAYDQAIAADVADLIGANNGEFVGVPGLHQGMIQTIETSAVQPSEVAELRELQSNVARGLGIDDGVRGEANRDATATAVSVAARATATKLDYLMNRWQRFVGDGMERIAWAVAHDDRVAVRLDESGREAVLRVTLEAAAAQAGLSPEYVEALIDQQKSMPIMFQGGDFAENDGELDWDSLDIFIEPHSMDGTYGDRALAREAAWNQQVAQIGMLAVQQPHIRWMDRLKATGRALGMADAEGIMDPQIAAQVAQIQLAAASPEPEVESMADGPVTDLRVIPGGSQRRGEPQGQFGAATA